MHVNMLLYMMDGYGHLNINVIVLLMVVILNRVLVSCFCSIFL